MSGVNYSGELRVLVAEWPVNPFFNLAFEEALYLEARCPTLRFWRNDKAIVIGRFQCPALEVNALEARRLGVKLVRRFTGGGAVYHDLGNLNYALTLPDYRLDMEKSFELVGEAVADALGSIGVNDVHYRPLNDVEVGGLKISGMAASRSRDRVFVHGALLVSSDLSTLWAVLKTSREKLSDKKFTESRVKRVTTLSDVLGRSVDVRDLLGMMAEAIADKLGLRASWSEVHGSELERALSLYEEKYSRLEWNLALVDELRDLINEEEMDALREIATPSLDQRKVVEGVKPWVG
ncbi:MAG: lipoate--protein ligase family protein [Zestosphaera sp.]